MIGTVALLALLLALSSFFSGAEIALFSVSQARVRALREERRRGSRSFAHLRANPERLLITILIGNNVANIGAAAVATYWATQAFGSSGVGLATGVMTLLVLFFGEIAPKTFAITHAVRIALTVAPLLEALQTILFPIVRPVEVLARWTLPRRMGSVASTTSEAEILWLSRAAFFSGKIDEREQRLIERAFLLDRTSAHEAMTPRVEIFAWPETHTVEEIAPQLRAVPFSRIPVYDGTVDHITGIVHLRDLYQAISSGRADVPLKELAREPFVVPDSMHLAALLSEFQNRRIHVGIVVDEYGGTDGLITLEDILEELVGEIHDEVDIPEEPIVRLGRNRILVDASAELREINHFFNTAFPAEEHRSLNGYLLHELGRVPERGETVEREGVRIEIVGATDTQVTLCRLIRVQPEAREGAEGEVRDGMGAQPGT